MRVAFDASRRATGSGRRGSGSHPACADRGTSFRSDRPSTQRCSYDFAPGGGMISRMTTTPRARTTRPRGRSSSEPRGFPRPRPRSSQPFRTMNVHYRPLDDALENRGNEGARSRQRCSTPDVNAASSHRRHAPPRDGQAEVVAWQLGRSCPCRPRRWPGRRPTTRSVHRHEPGQHPQAPARAARRGPGRGRSPAGLSTWPVA